MYTRFIAPLCCAAAVAFACGPRSHSSAVAFAVPVKKRTVTVPDGPTVTSTLRSDNHPIEVRANFVLP